MFSLCFLPSAARSLKRTKNTGDRNLVIWDPLAHFEVEGWSKFLFGKCVTKQQVVPRVVCLCGAVGVCGEYHLVGHVVISVYNGVHF